MTPADEHLSRDDRRRRTEAAILRAARALFAEAGFERTTIRGVASRAGVDPALVMHHYGSKEALFAAAARWRTEHERVLSATLDQLPAAALDDLLDKLEGEDRESAVALIRNCLTHPSAARVMRDEVMCDRQAAVADLIEGPDAALRGSLFAACMIGLGIARNLLEIEPLANASRADVHRVMEPVLRALVEPAPDAPG